MKPIVVASALLLTLTACGGPSEEDVLTPEKIRASESAPVLPDVELSENPEPPPAPAPPPEDPTLNELGNEVEEPEPVDVEDMIPAAFQDRWGTRPADCRPGDVVGNGLLVGPESLMTGEAVGRLVEVVSSGPGRVAAVFDYDGEQQVEELTLSGGGNALVRNGVTYRRCSAASPTG